jgi:hypothetical protein
MFKELKVVQNSDEWFNARIGKITASHFDEIMPSSKQKKLPYNDTQAKYLYKVAAEILTNEREDSYTSKHMEWGNTYEPFAKKFYSDLNMCVVRDPGFFTDEAFLGDSPDGIIERERTLEFKCPTSKQHFFYSLYPEELYKAYRWQAIGHCFFTGIHQGSVCSYDPRFPEDKRLIEYKFEPTLEEFTQLNNRLEECVYTINGWLK